MNGEPINPRPRREVLPGVMGIAPVSFALIAISVIVAIYSDLGNKQEALAPLLISLQESGARSLPEVRHGQYWRLLTPAFIHFGPLHLIFNMMWVKDLGSAIERRHGAMYFIAMTAAIIIPSNLGQYYLSGPGFGGMSGAVYGWFGYVWMRSYFDPQSGFRMPRQLLMWMIGWFVLCLTGIAGPVANAAHGVGLVAGAVWGMVASSLARRSPLDG